MTKEKYILEQVKMILKESIDSVENQMQNDNLIWHNEQLLEYIEELERGDDD